MTLEQRPLCADCRKPRPLMRDGRCPHCSETYRLKGQPKDFLPSINDVDARSPLEKNSMTITKERSIEAPTMLPGPITGWTGHYKACRDCGRRTLPEVEDGLCTECYGEHFGATGLRLAEARRDSRRPAAPVAEPTSLTVDCVECRRTIDQATAIRYTSGEYACKDVEACMAAAGRSQFEPAPPAPAWHPEFDACLDCGRTDRPYGSRGLCKTCYPATLKPGYAGNAAPPKPPGRRGVSTPRLESAPPAPVALPHRDEASVESVAASVAYHSAQLGITPEQPAPLPVEPEVTNDDVRQDIAETVMPAVDAPVAAALAPEEPQEVRVPTILASTVIARVQTIFDTKPSLEEIPLAELLAEVNRRTKDLAVRLVAAERDACRFRRVEAVLRDANEGAR